MTGWDPDLLAILLFTLAGVLLGAMVTALVLAPPPEEPYTGRHRAARPRR